MATKTYKEQPLQHNDKALSPSYDDVAKKLLLEKDQNDQWGAIYRKTGPKRTRAIVGLRKDPDGSVNEVTVPHLPYEKWVAADGDVINLTIGTSRDPQAYKREHADFERVRMAKAGGFPFEYEDARRMGFGELGFDDGITPDAWATIRDSKINELRDEYRRANSQFTKMAMTQIDVLKEALGVSRETLEALKVMVEKEKQPHAAKAK
jgi:hypothetical protein